MKIREFRIASLLYKYPVCENSSVLQHVTFICLPTCESKNRSILIRLSRMCVTQKGFFINTIEPGYNDTGLCSISSVASNYSVVPINSLLLTL